VGERLILISFEGTFVLGGHSFVTEDWVTLRRGGRREREGKGGKKGRGGIHAVK
jgi:hypothetical protein